ncbi:sulfite oxidase heme-binding subunit YedZ [Gymnodinialimonas ulvae]|uniref:sulfite oxidase heme-binding subunit YedZ n=1 Tax=Gymnodinialimonas ulvae TaxID=3126504 RepID=UPI0030AD30C7
MSRLSPYWLWALLAVLPALFTFEALTSTDPEAIHGLLHPSGEFAARLLILTMMISPLALIFRQSRFIGWLRHNRRYFGVAAFGYALLHTVFYLIDEGSLAAVTGDLPKLYIWTGWVAFAIFIPLAMTSMDAAVRAMGPHWKSLRRTTYVASLFTLLHWASLHDWGGTGPALVHFGPLLALEAYRGWYWFNRSAKRRMAKA